MWTKNEEEASFKKEEDMEEEEEEEGLEMPYSVKCLLYKLDLSTQKACWRSKAPSFRPANLANKPTPGPCQRLYKKTKWITPEE